MVNVKISKNVIYNVNLDGMKVTVSISYTGVRFSLKGKKGDDIKYSQTMYWHDIHETFMKMLIEQSNKEGCGDAEIIKIMIDGD